MSVKLIEDTKIIRIDTQVYAKETADMPIEIRRPNTLKDCKIIHNSALLVEKKD